VKLKKNYNLIDYKMIGDEIKKNRNFIAYFFFKKIAIKMIGNKCERKRN